MTSVVRFDLCAILFRELYRRQRQFDRGVHLTWDPVAGASGYEIFRAEGVLGCDQAKAKVGATADTEWIDVGLQNGRAYFYVVIPKGPAASCFGNGSACTPATPVAGGRVGAGAIATTILTGDGDPFVDDCEAVLVEVEVANLGTGTATGIEIADVSSPSHPATVVVDPLPIAVPGSLAECAAAGAAFEIVAHGLAHGDTLVLEVVLDSAEMPVPVVHTIALEIPLSELGGDQQVVGVYATTSRKKERIIRTTRNVTDEDFVQVGRQGNPLFCEGLVAVADKDRYNRQAPDKDAIFFAKYAENPELAKLLNLIVLEPDIPGIETGRKDIAGIFIPDVIKVDLSTKGARLAGGGPDHPTNPDDAGFSRLSIFGGDTLVSQIQPGFGGGVVPGGWPNGRRFGDDVVDIAVTALISDLRTSPPIIRGPAGDNVNANDMAFNKVFPYESTPQNGRRHVHH